MALAACGDDGPGRPMASPSSTAALTATQALVPAATSTPDLVPPKPASAGEAGPALDAYLRAGGTACGSAFTRKWGIAGCFAADLDGDGRADLAVLLPLAQGENPRPGVLLVRRGASGQTEVFPGAGSIDLGALGAPLVAVADRNGDSRPEVTYLVTVCGSPNCTSQIEVQTWDGTAWRDLVAPGPGITNPDRATVTGSGAGTAFEMHGGGVASAGAGPARGVTVKYTYAEGAYRAAKVTPDAAGYLIHAVADADERFAAGDFEDAATAYRAAATASTLRDWKQEAGKPPGRPALVGYALFRVAVAKAALGAPANEVRAAFDDVFTGSSDALFHNATEAFRRGYLEGGGNVHLGCLEVTRYLLQPEVAAFVREAFDYGYANPRKNPADVCPL